MDGKLEHICALEINTLFNPLSSHNHVCDGTRVCILPAKPPTHTDKKARHTCGNSSAHEHRAAHTYMQGIPTSPWAHSTHPGGTTCSKDSHEEGVLLHTGWTMTVPAESQLISALIKVLFLLTGHRTYTPTLGLDPGPLRSCRWAGPEPLKGLVWLVIRDGDSAEEQ